MPGFELSRWLKEGVAAHKQTPTNLARRMTEMSGLLDCDTYCVSDITVLIAAVSESLD